MRVDRLLIRGLVYPLTLAIGVHASQARKWPDPPAWWTQAAQCIHRYESADWHNRNSYFSGGYQFLDTTWWAVGGRGRAADASPAEQTYRAWLLYQQVGWSAWPTTSRICGLR